MLEYVRFTTEEIEKKLLSFDENKLSKDVLIPLFEKIFTGSAQFTGGPLEKGRDILITRTDELGENQYIAVQVKKLKVTGNTQHSGGMQQLINQLSQASMEPVIDASRGLSIKIDRLLFVTPYTIPQTVLDSHQMSFRRLVEGHPCKVIDGTKLVDLIKKHRPDLINILFEPARILTNSIRDKLKNSILMTALDRRVFRDISEIHCDLSFFVGNDVRRISKITPKNNERVFRLSINESTKYKHLNKIFHQLTDKDIFDFSGLEKTKLSVSEEKNKRNKLKLNEKKIESILQEIEEKIENFAIWETGGSFLSEKISNKLRQAVMQLSSVDYRTSLNNLFKVSENFNSENRKKYFALLKPFRTKLLHLIKENESISEDLERSHFNLIFYTERLSSFLNEELEHLSQKQVSTVEECRVVLKRMSTIQDLYPLTKLFSDTFQETNYTVKSKFVRQNIPLETVFRTNLNIAVLGDAGSGKTTSLQMYTHQLLMNDNERFVLYASLAELGDQHTQRPIDLLESIVQYLRSLTIQVNSDDVKTYLNSGTAILLLDSIDEGIAVYPEIIESLSSFAKAFPRCQIITSSRSFVLRDSMIPFHQITLLPFGKEQLSLFLQRWFIDDTKASNAIENHLKTNTKLSKIVTNPLSATILCVLCENGVPLPQSEAMLYSRRLELLAGKFDREKKILRLTNPPDHIVEAAKIVGFEMHVRRTRTVDHDEIHSILSGIEFIQKAGTQNKIIQDFIASEIMIHVTKSDLSFGHLRYQEFLASEELKNRRSFPTDKLLRDPWWHGPIMIYAQTAREVEWLFNHANVHEYIREVKEILRSILTMRPKKEKEKLQRQLSIALLDDYEN